MEQDQIKQDDLIQKLIKYDEFQPLLDLANVTVEGLKEELVHCDKKDEDIIRGRIIGIREILLL